MSTTGILRDERSAVLRVLRVLVGVVGVVGVALLCGTLVRPEPSPPTSQFGQYSGAASPSYTEWTRTSCYIAARDGTRLAADIYRPARRRQSADPRLPVIWTLTRYHRADLDARGAVVSPVDTRRAYQRLLAHGYILAFVDARGAGASFGHRDDPFSPQDGTDAYDVTEWLAAQPWSNAQIGMMGDSFSGIVQYFAAATAPPSLKAIVPAKALFDLYDFAYPGGLWREDFSTQWSSLVRRLDLDVPSTPVDGDDGARLLSAAQAEHRANRYASDLLGPLATRDVLEPDNRRPVFAWRSPSSQLDLINRSGVAVYQVAGWLDLWPKDALTWFANLRLPQRLVIGPWSHIGTPGLDMAAESLRFFDRYLKGIDNGISREAPIHYYTLNAPPARAWHEAWSWPVPHVPTPFHLCPGPSHTVERGALDGALCAAPPRREQGDDYTVDPTTTTGRSTRWTEGYGARMAYPDLSEHDRKSAPYTSPPLTRDLEVTGHPILRIWISSPTRDATVLALLEDVDPSGRAQYLTEGVLRASFRKSSPSPYGNFGLPYHSGLAEDVQPLPPGEPVLLVFDLLPLSAIIQHGHRVRLTLAGADRDNLLAEGAALPSRYTIHHGGPYPSALTLPVVDQARSDPP